MSEALLVAALTVAFWAGWWRGRARTLGDVPRALNRDGVTESAAMHVLGRDVVLTLRYRGSDDSWCDLEYRLDGDAVAEVVKQRDGG